MDQVFTLQSQREANTVEGRVTLGAPSSASHAACDAPPDTLSNISRDVTPDPWTCPGKLLLGTGPGVHCSYDTFRPVATINIEVFPKLFMALVQAMRSKWFRLYLCFGRPLEAALAKNTLLCCGLDCIYITHICENQEEAVDVVNAHRDIAMLCSNTGWSPDSSPKCFALPWSSIAKG
ncbi:hypothetical protein WISP_93796 [Willisornis vidua]|uniref:Uncharacterized protein n=1 Tax=Willisornis vidua TaxID=1566151 RepID=A0ABQ9D620_9PASS|nr:hypothetical protein WISP_93796 [Willisornis vidua]